MSGLRCPAKNNNESTVLALLLGIVRNAIVLTHTNLL
jgi:hypothetical protein